MGGTSKGGKKAAAKLIAQNPNHYSELSRRAKKPRGGDASPGSFKRGDSTVQSLGGKASRRGPGKAQRLTSGSDVLDAKLEYEEQ